jgi:hypothetical protein
VRTQPRNEIDLAPRGVAERLAGADGVRRPPHLDAGGKIDIGRHHADDGECVVAEKHAAPDRVARRTVSPLPEPVADHENFFRAVDVVRARESSSEERPHVQNVEKVAGHQRALHVAGRTVLGYTLPTGAVRVDARDALEQQTAFAHRIDLEVSEWIVGEPRRPQLFPGHEQSILVPDRQRTEQHAANEREHHRGAGEANRQRENCGSAEAFGSP